MGDQDEPVDARDGAVDAQDEAVDTDETFDALLRQSSLGATGARQLSERTPLSLARAVRRIADDEVPDGLRASALRAVLATASAEAVDASRVEQASGRPGEPSRRQSSAGRAPAARARTSVSQGTRERSTDGPGRSAVGLQESRNSDVSRTTGDHSTGDHSAAAHTRADHTEEADHTDEQCAEAPRLWHVTLSVTGPARPLAEVRRALEQLAHEYPFILTTRYATDHAEIRYWEEARDLHDAAAVALRVWGEHRGSAGLPWEVDGLEVIDRQTYHQRIADASAVTDSGVDEPRGGRGKAVADRGRPSGDSA